MPIPAAATGTDPVENPPPIQGFPASLALAKDPGAVCQRVGLDLASPWTEVHPFGNLHASTPLPTPANAGPAHLPAGGSGALPRGGALLLVRTRARPPTPRILNFGWPCPHHLHRATTTEQRWRQGREVERENEVDYLDCSGVAIRRKLRRAGTCLHEGPE